MSAVTLAEKEPTAGELPSVEGTGKRDCWLECGSPQQEERDHSRVQTSRLSAVSRSPHVVSPKSRAGTEIFWMWGYIRCVF